jgi:hypothetical protein
MERSSLYWEIFGGDDLAAVSKPVSAPQTLLDDPLFSLLPGNGAADAAIQHLVDDQFGADIAGLKPEEFRRIVAKSATTSINDCFAKSAPREKRLAELDAQFNKLVASEVRQALIPFRAAQIVEKKKSTLAKRAPLRRAAFTKMLRPLRELFEKTNPYGYDDERFASLLGAMENFVTSAIMSEA